MQYPILMILVVLWLVIGLPLAKLSQQAKKNNAAKNAAQKRVQQPAAEPVKPAAPAVSAPEPPVLESRLRPTISVTEHDDSIYQGSLNAVTGEGYDPCHDEQLAPLSAAETAVPAAEAAAPGLQLAWTGSDVVRGFVMSEILKRKQ